MSAPSLVGFRSEAVEKHGPSALLLHWGMLMTGLGMTVLGPILPLLMAGWGFKDSQAGLLLTAQFVGMSLGSIAIFRELSRSLLAGIAGSVAGFGGIAVMVSVRGTIHGTWPVGCVLLFVAGFGLGQLITSVNLIGGERFKRKRGPALSLLNFSWSVGAVLSPVVASRLGPQFPMAALFGGLAGVFVLLGVEAWREYAFSGAAAGIVGPDDLVGPRAPIPSEPPELAAETSPKGISADTFYISA